jgi:hypothetical protein
MVTDFNYASSQMALNLGYLTTEDRTQKNAPALALVHSQNYHLPKHEANEKKLENY